MLSLRTSSSFSLTFTPSKHLCHPKLAKPTSAFKSYSQCLSFSRSGSSIKMSSSSTKIVEHIVLFKVKNDTESSNVNAMVNGVSSLINLDSVLYLTVGPLCPTTSDFGFTHMLHSRYSSKENLEAYKVHPNHLDVAKEFVYPICDDLMAIDWFAEPDLSTQPGSAIRVSFLKLKENVGNEVKKEVLEVVGGIKDSVKGISQLSWGENFSPARAKGFSIASLAVFPGQRELQSVDWNEELVKVRDYLDSVLLVDYVVP